SMVESTPWQLPRKPGEERPMAGLRELNHPEAESPAAARLGRSPLTDPRALASSILVHALLLAVASVMAARGAAPQAEPPPSRTLGGEIEAVDNRAESEPGGGGGGTPEGRAADVSAETGTPAPPTRDPAADALISEVLPTRPSAETPAATL